MLLLNRNILSSVQAGNGGSRSAVSSGRAREQQQQQQQQQQQSDEDPAEDAIHDIDNLEEAFTALSPKGIEVIAQAKVGKEMHEKLCSVLSISPASTKSTNLENYVKDNCGRGTCVTFGQGYERRPPVGHKSPILLYAESFGDQKS